MEKAPSAIVSSVLSHDLESTKQLVFEKSGTSNDAEDMRRLGRVQELRVSVNIASVWTKA